MSQTSSLDPEDWDAFRRLSHQALDAALDDLMRVPQGPVWRETPPEVLARLDDAAPEAGVGLEQVLGEFARDIQPFGVGNRHPAFFGWAHGAGTPVGMIAEMLAGELNLNCGGRNHIGVALERKIAAAMAGKFGFPATASGLFVTGASQANFHGVLLARRAALGPEVRVNGVAGAPLRAYASIQAHACVEQAMDLAGLGTQALRPIPCDAEGRMRLDLLRDAIAADRDAGARPFLLVGTAGTVNFGAFDPLPDLADIAAQEKLWLHVDGAFGALTVFSEQLRPLIAGIERADSLAFDFHKWAHVPYDAGFILARDGAAQRAAFAAPAAYLSRTETGLAKGETWPCDLGPDLSRGFRALKVWMTLRAYGVDRIGACMARNCADARALAALIDESMEFERAAPVPLNIVCFRLRDGDDAANRALVERLQVAGLAAPSLTRLEGRTAIRCALFNHRTGGEDVRAFFDAARQQAKAVQK
ncbi:Glutamate or tyrosine decarboxylase [Rhodoblastus acidophilus]|uniref:Glutamate or tyrosine decarboxylase n=1 Tax=Rhodoblastus acidophilus TaxID=1074 RepID=A0A212QK97_RHOAC|nr:pyridoxal-dependent decarboxylase [Rhodoblastus acidophilus]PPQ39919.1 cytochrome D ubiquinol oxidase subunit I [Rhodoblastus acidophilus]RAI23307.1 cytochrome D ubiquinol oxidase subunit I [Rhodoblastus acidophilus]SNB59795.1 Glutamate or tyrosine decarboxylase [Rhodoblastus acidophilus]